MQKRAWIVTSIIPALLICGTVVVLLNNQRELPGELVLAQERIDFGAVAVWEGPVTKSLTARNVGETRLQIGRIQPGCTYAQIEGPSVLPPRADGTFKIVLNPETLPPDPRPTTATFFTDSPKTPQVYLTIVASTVPFAALSAEICDFGAILPNTQHKKKVELYLNAPLNLDAVRLLPSNQPSLTWEMERELGHHTAPLTALLTVHLGPLQNRKRFSGQLTVAFPNERTLTLPVIAHVVGPVTVQPQTLSYGAIPSETEPTLEVTLSAKTPFEVLNVEAPEVLQVVFQAEALSVAQNRKRLKIVWKSSNSPQLLREEIRVKTTADALTLRIPVYGFRTHATSEP